MAGKKKNQIDDGGKQSKTSRASSLKKGGKQEGFIAAAPEHLDRFISLGGGTFSYFLDPRNGRTYRFGVGSDRWNTFFTEALASNHGPRIQAEMEKKGLPIPVPQVEDAE